MIDINEDEFRRVCEESHSMASACVKIGMHFNTFKKHAQRIGCYNPNASGKGISKRNANKIKLIDILNGEYPSYQTFKLKKRLIIEGFKENKCERCETDSWMGEEIQIELDHIDGDSNNHKFENLRMLCPNCHSQTPTFRNKIRDKN